LNGSRTRHGWIALLAALSASPGSALAPGTSLSAERAIETQKDSVREVVGTLPCRRGGDSRDIVVCGRRGPNPNRPPIPFEQVPGEPENLLPGELSRARTSYDNCMIACPRPVTVTDEDAR
jgi:hypothetical protein